ncbi:MAG: hypothetical protein IT336_14430 [Thermomicrobiales bacterium]|nr:hypothetical protein [Thermomicrobiales bacterium]
MNRVRRRIERSGFFLFFFAFFLLALGLAQGISILIYTGLAVLLLILAVVIIRSARDVMRPRRRIPPASTSATSQPASRANRGTATHDPDNY